jgi:hypothetical protein
MDSISANAHTITSSGVERCSSVWAATLWTLRLAPTTTSNATATITVEACQRAERQGTRERGGSERHGEPAADEQGGGGTAEQAARAERCTQVARGAGSNREDLDGEHDHEQVDRPLDRSSARREGDQCPSIRARDDDPGSSEQIGENPHFLLRLRGLGPKRPHMSQQRSQETESGQRRTRQT